MAYNTQYKAIHFPLNPSEARLLTWEEHPSLEELQALVGGPIEVVRTPKFAGCTLLVNEEGLLKTEPMLNRVAYNLCGAPLVGDLLLLLFPLE
jgi:Domain of unknown function (DUF3846)